MCKAKKIEFYVSPNGRVMVDEDGVPIQREYTEDDQELTNFVLGLAELAPASHGRGYTETQGA